MQQTLHFQGLLLNEANGQKVNLMSGVSKYLTEQQLSDLSGISVATIRRYKAKGQIEFFQPGGKGCAVRYPADALHKTNNSLLSSAPDKPRKLSGPLPKWQK